MEPEIHAIKPCPFCGSHKLGIIKQDDRTWIVCPTHTCEIYISEVALDVWQNRPIEDELNVRIAALESQRPRWISVGERLPELCQVVFFGGNNFVDVGHYTKELPQWTSVLNSGGFWYGKKCKLVTHWMPLPSAPESEDE